MNSSLYIANIYRNRLHINMYLVIQYQYTTTEYKKHASHMPIVMINVMIFMSTRSNIICNVHIDLIILHAIAGYGIYNIKVLEMVMYKNIHELFVLTLFVLSIVARSPSNQRQLKNVLFIAIDDLRPELGAYGSNVIRSPNIDKLASQSIVFERAYCQVPVCSPSRASLLTGRRPDTNHVWRIADNEYWRDYTNATTIPQYFKDNGYISVGMGKIFHPGAPSGYDDRAYSWSLPYYHAPVVAGNHKVWESFEGYADDQLQDGQLADNAIEGLLRRCEL